MAACVRGRLVKAGGAQRLLPGLGDGPARVGRDTGDARLDGRRPGTHVRPDDTPVPLRPGRRVPTPQSARRRHALRQRPHRPPTPSHSHSRYMRTRSAIGRVRPSVRFHAVLRTNWPLTFLFLRRPSYVDGAVGARGQSIQFSQYVRNDKTPHRFSKCR